MDTTVCQSGPNVGTVLAADGAHKSRLDIRKPRVVRPAIRDDRDRVVAPVFRAIGQDPRHDGGAQRGEGDLGVCGQTCSLPAHGSVFSTGDLKVSPFENITTQLEQLGIVLTKGGGEYHPSFCDDRAKVCAIVDSLDEALMRGLEMAESSQAKKCCRLDLSATQR